MGNLQGCKAAKPRYSVDFRVHMALMDSSMQSPTQDRRAAEGRTRGEVDVKMENAAFERAVGGSNNRGLPVKKILADRSGTNVAGRVLSCNSQGERKFRMHTWRA